MQKQYHGYRGHLPRRPGPPPMRGFRPRGLVGDLMIGGLGYLIGRQQARRQHHHHYQQSSQAPASSSSDQLAQLKLLGELRESGILTEEEFQVQKQKILQVS